MAINIKHLEKYIDNNYNILLQGLHGTGKTTILTQACHNLGLKMLYYSAPTLDPYTDLVGVPVPEIREDGTKVLTSVRPVRIDQAEVVFFDELNRADPKVQNAVFELVQFRRINGVTLPKLKCVVAAQNPPNGDYDVDSLDPALADRFHVYLNVKEEPSITYFTQNGMDRNTARAVVKWRKEHDTSKAPYVSPRRLEIIGRAWDTFGTKAALEDCMPEGSNLEVQKLYLALKGTTSEAEGTTVEDLEEKIFSYDHLGIRNNIEPATIGANWRSLNEDAREKVISSLHQGIGPIIGSKYADILKELNDEESKKLAADWPPQKLKGTKDQYKFVNTPFGKHLVERIG